MRRDETALPRMGQAAPQRRPLPRVYRPLTTPNLTRGGSGRKKMIATNGRDLYLLSHAAGRWSGGTVRDKKGLLEM